MTGPFETVAEIEEWLEGEPTREKAEEALQVEQKNANRTTGKEAIRSYLDSLPEPGGGSETVEYRVQHPFGDHEIGDIVELDPDDEQTTMLRRDGRLTIT